VAEPALLLVLLWWMGLAGIGSTLMMGLDKLLAKMHAWRISERSFFLAAMIGGVVGIIVGAFLFHHKTSKSSFWPAIVLAGVVWGAVLLALVYY
jgi:uncharacterized membrane protein YsdA (DUF1294 family)